MANTIDIPIRPLIQGIRKDVPENLVPLGAFSDINNIYVTKTGLKKRGCIYIYRDLDAVDYPPIQGIETFWDTTGNKTTIIFDKKFIYAVTAAGYVRKEWTYATGTCSSSGRTVTGSGTLWDTAASYVQAGDLFVLDANGSGDGPEEILIASVTDDTHLELASTPAGTYGASTDYKIVRAFKFVGQDLLDWATRADLLYYTDHDKPVVKWDGTTFTVVDSGLFKARCLTYFNDRLILGNTINVTDGTYHKQRFRWGNRASETLTDDNHYLDLPYTSDELLRLIPLGSLLIAYFENSIWYGQPTNMQSDLPYAFTRLDTGGIGLVGQRAVIPWTDGHFFIGQDNFYYLNFSSQQPLTPVGNAVFDFVDRLEIRDSLWRSYVSVDPLNDSIVFGLPGSGSAASLSCLFVYNYFTQSWSKHQVTLDFLGTKSLVDITQYDELEGTYDDLVGTYDELSSGPQSIALWHGLAGRLSTFRDTVVTDDGSTISVSLDTGDMDFDQPNMYKGFYKMTLKLREPYTNSYSSENLVLFLQGSVDRGTTWKDLGSFTIEENESEAVVFFRLLGGQARFRIYNNSVNFDTFTIEEIVLTISGKGKETVEKQSG